MKKKARTAKEQAVVQSRVAAAVRLQAHRPKVETSVKNYDRSKQKRLWQKDQEALPSFYSSDWAALRMTGASCSAKCRRAVRASSDRIEPMARTIDSQAWWGARASASIRSGTARSRPTLAIPVAATAAR